MGDHMQIDSDSEGARQIPTNPVSGSLANDLLDGLSITSSFSSSDALVLEVTEALRVQLVESQPSVRNGMEMKHILLLLVKTFHDLCDSTNFEKQDWLAKMRETVSQEGYAPQTVREYTGDAIIQKFEASAWGLEKRPGQTRSDTVHTILAVHAGMVRFIKTLEAELDKKAQEGVDLKAYDVEEMGSDDDEEEDVMVLNQGKFVAVPKIIVHPPQQPTSPNKRKTTGTGSGNHSHGFLTLWNNAEWLHVLKLYRDNPKTAAKDIAAMHNDRFWAAKGSNVQRTTDAVRQQYKKMVGAGSKDETMAKVPGKIAELEAGMGEEDEEGDDESGDE